MSSDLWIPWCFLHHSVNGCFGLGVFFTSFAVFLISVYSHTTLLHSSFVTAPLSRGLLPSSLSQLHNKATKVRKNQTAGRITAVHKNNPARTNTEACGQRGRVRRQQTTDNTCLGAEEEPLARHAPSWGLCTPACWRCRLHPSQIILRI